MRGRERSGSSGLSGFEAGVATGPVVVYFHGTPKTSSDSALLDLAGPLGIRLLAFDRPGYGSSPSVPDASLGDVARMVLAELDHDGVAKFSVLGWSGGGPHALACAAVAPERVLAVGLLGSWAPMNPPDRGLPFGVRFAMRVAAALPRGAVRLMLLGRPSSTGMADDVRRVARPWGFGVDQIARSVRVVAWHADGDRTVPAGPWRHIDGVELRVLAGDSHEVSRDLWERALREVAGGGAPG